MMATSAKSPVVAPKARVEGMEQKNPENGSSLSSRCEAGACNDGNCSVLRGVRVVETCLLESEFTLSVVPQSTRMLSFSSYCGAAQPNGYRNICAKIALWDFL